MRSNPLSCQAWVRSDIQPRNRSGCGAISFAVSNCFTPFNARERHLCRESLIFRHIFGTCCHVAPRLLLHLPERLITTDTRREIPMARQMSTHTRWATAFAATASLAIASSAAAQTPPPATPPAQTPPPATAAQDPAAAPNPAQDAAKQQLTAARNALSELTQLPAASQLTGEARSQVQQLISNFNELITTNSNWRASYAKVEGTLGMLLPAEPPPAASGTPGAVGTSGTTAAIDPAVRARLVQFREHLKKFEAIASATPAPAAAPAPAASEPPPAAPPSTPPATASTTSPATASTTSTSTTTTTTTVCPARTSAGPRAGGRPGAVSSGHLLTTSKPSK